jgi:hypothetical protein
VKKKKRGNIEASEGPDPFPKTGLVKQYEPFIRSYVGKFCCSHPGAIYEHALVDAVRIATDCAARFKPELGFDFSTPLREWLKRLGRLFEQDQHRIKIPQTEGYEEEADEAAPVVYRGGNRTRITIDRQWSLNGSRNCRQRVVIGAQLNSTNESEAREAIERASAALGKLLDDRPLTEIRAAIHDTIGKDADVQFPKPRKPPNFHEWPAMVLVSFDQVVGEDDDGGKLYLKDVVAGSDPRSIPNADSDVDKLRRAIEAERPFLSPNERRVLDEWKLDRCGGRLSHWAARNGIDKGYASRMNSKIEKRFAQRMKKNF